MNTFDLTKNENGVYTINISMQPIELTDINSVTAILQRLADIDNIVLSNNSSHTSNQSHPYYSKLTVNQLREVHKYVIGQEKLQAVKYIKDMIGVGLKEAKDFVDIFVLPEFAKSRIYNSTT